MSQAHLEPETVDEDAAFSEPVPAAEIIGRSPGQIFWRRFRKDKLALRRVSSSSSSSWRWRWQRRCSPSWSATRSDAQYVVRDDDAGRCAARAHDQQRGGRVPLRRRRHGADLFVRVLYGAQTSLIVALAATVIELLLGVTLGHHRRASTAARSTRFISGLTDIFFALPTLLLMLGISGRAARSRRGRSAWAGLLQPGRGLIAFVIGVLRVALPRAHHPRPGAVDPREGVRRGVALAGRVEPPDHVQGDPAQRAGADHRLHDADHPHEHLARGVAVVPGPRRAALDPVVGRGRSTRRRPTTGWRGG